ncbi:hypothetical protein PMAYCL1PPCAC_27355, partial [Pristionchus mayeri]
RRSTMSCSFAIAITPDRCNISAAGGTSKHKMVNQCDRKLAFKVRSSNNSNYSVNMIGGFIDVAETKEFIITRRAGKPQPDKLLICFCDATGPDALEHFKGEAKGEVVGETLIKLSAAE